MTRGTVVDEVEAAALLGVAVDATTDEVRRAWRVWARLAHPDAGGDPDVFARLDLARRTLLRARPAALDQHSLGPQSPRHEVRAPQPRAPWRLVLTRPAHVITLAIGAAIAVALAALPARIAAPLAIAAVPAFLTATMWAVWAAREVLSDRADHGHRITALALLWLPIAGAQVAASIIAGTSLVPVLPLSALPLAAAVAAVNPGAGLWRPVSGSRQPPP